MAGIIAAIVGGGIISAGASIYGANKQASAAQAGITAETNMFNTAQAGEQPFITAGQSAIPSLEALLGTGPPGTPSPTDMLKNVPGYNFIADIAQKGVSNQGTVTGL